MLITATLAHLGGFGMHWAMFFSHLKYMAAWATGNLHLIVHHYTYDEVYALVRPALHWSPV